MADISHCTVLLVDDTVENMDILVETLGDVVEVAVAMDGRSAMEAVDREIPDLVLLDIEMPDMDGYEVMRRLRANPRAAGIPIIFLSARSGIEEKTQAMALGAVDFITKPFVAAEVLAKIKDILSKRRSGERDVTP